jgi:formyl-CoA transferase
VAFTDHPLVTAHPQVAAIGALCDVPVAGGGTVRGVAPVWKFAETPATVQGPAPRLGQHTDDLLAALGLSPAEVQALRTKDIVA